MSKNKRQNDSEVQWIKQSKGIDISFTDILFQVQNSNGGSSKMNCFGQVSTRVILDKISGIFKAGSMSAIMGASGAGKTTLLNILACKITNITDGVLSANDILYNQRIFGLFAKYVMQADILTETMTVRETLQFAADLKLQESNENKKQTIENLVKNLKLEKALDVLIGGSLLKGISGGEKRRCSIAFELIGNPKVIMLDQPTSGLDSLTSYIIIKYLHKLAHEENRTVIMTIHQPSKPIFDLFDKFLLLVQGKIIFQDCSSKGIEYLRNKFSLQCPYYMSPPDFFMQIVHPDLQANRRRYQKYFLSYQFEGPAKSILNQIEQRNKDQINLQTMQVSHLILIWTLTKRNFTNTIRNPMVLLARISQAVVLSLFVGGVFYNVGNDFRDGKLGTDSRSLVGFLFYICMSTLICAIVPVVLTFPSQRSVFLKESSSNMYGVGHYFLSRNLIEIPMLFIVPLIQCLILYWMGGLQSTAQKFFIFYFISFLLSFVGDSMGLFIGGTFPDIRVAASVVPLILTPMILFSGFYKKRQDYANWIGWIEYFSPLKYSFSAVAENQMPYFPVQLGIWHSIGLLAILALTFRIASFLFLWYLRTSLQ